MTGVDVALWGAAVALAGAATWLTLPRPPALDWELYFKLIVATRMRGDIEAAGGSPDAWVDACRGRVWYHPGGRELERKIAEPGAYDPPVPALEGERALLESLAKLDSSGARLRQVLGGDRFDEALFSDPSALGSDYDLQAALGPGAGWEGVASWSEALLENLRRRNELNTWVVVGEGALVAGLAAELESILGEGRALHVPIAEAGAPGEDLTEALKALLPSPSSRLLLLVRGAAAGPLLTCLHDNADLRDRARLIVGVGAELAPLAEWMAANFDHQQMDTEIARALPYMHMGFLVPDVDPVGEAGAPLSGSRFPDVPDPPTGRRAIESIELGPLIGPSEGFPPALLARALAVFLTARLAIAG